MSDQDGGTGTIEALGGTQESSRATAARTLFRNALRVAVLVALFLFFKNRISVAEFHSVLANTSAPVLALAALLTVVSTVDLATLQMTALPALSSHSRHLRQLNRLSLAYSAFLPSAIVSTHRISAMRAFEIPYTHSVHATILSKLAQVLAAAVVIVAASSTLLSSGELSRATSLEAVVITACILLAIGLMLLGLHCAGPFGTSLGKTDATQGSLRQALGRLMEYSGGLRPAALVKALGWGLAGHLLTVGGATLVAWALFSKLDLAAMAIARSTVLLVGLAPISTAGVGAREVALLAILPVFGYSTSEVLALSLNLFIVHLIAAAFAMASYSARRLIEARR